MRFLLVAKQKKNLDSFRATIRHLLDGGHEVRLAIQERDQDRDRKLEEEFAGHAFSVQSAPAMRGDEWRMHAPLLRALRDWVHYLTPPYAGAHKLRQRAVDKLRAELGAAGASLGDGSLSGLSAGPVERLRALLERCEAAVPSDPLHQQFVSAPNPDVVLVTPGVHFGSAQADFIKSARAAGIPVWMLLFSWDNLSTKGALHETPDLMFVWNERQRREAAELHRFPSERVVTVGAPRFDEFFALRPVVRRERFFAPVGLDPTVPTLLYVCSSRFIASRELRFVERWLAALRGSADPLLRTCNVVVRPHPDVALVDDSDAEIVRWPELPRAQGWVTRPFGDARAVVLRTTYATQQAFFECIHHAAAVVGLNTSAELEAAIVGRPVFTVTADDEAVTGQSNTLHFHYLLKENGGFVVSAPDLASHVGHLQEAVRTPDDGEAIRAFAREFLRPRGNRPAAEVLAAALVERAGLESRDRVARAVSGARVGLIAAAAAPAAAPAPAETDEKPVKALRVAYPGSALQVFATPETRKIRRSGQLLLEPSLVAWLDEHVQPGEVVYDIGAGVGECSLVAAVHRGALAVAFEPGFATFKRLCDNLLLNNCRRSVMPLSIALAERAGLLEMEYAPDAAGEDRHHVKERPWRTRHDGAEPFYVQPVCAQPLDEVIRQYRLPRPNHIRVRSAAAVDAVLGGATVTLRDSGVRSLLLPRRASDATGDPAADQRRRGDSHEYVVLRPESLATR